MVMHLVIVIAATACPNVIVDKTKKTTAGNKKSGE